MKTQKARAHSVAAASFGRVRSRRGLFACPAIVRSAAPNSSLQVACIGVGGMGGSTMKSVASHAKVKIVALCEVDERTLTRPALTYPDASRHRDWREDAHRLRTRRRSSPWHGWQRSSLCCPHAPTPMQATCSEELGAGASNDCRTSE